jgi:DNA-binding transcriptional MerR regulator
MMNFLSKKIISSKEIVRIFGLPYSTVTYYTNLGFFMVVKRKGNRRFYDKEEISRQLKRITELRDSGYPLRLIRKKLVG